MALARNFEEESYGHFHLGSRPKDVIISPSFEKPHNERFSQVLSELKIHINLCSHTTITDGFKIFCQKSSLQYLKKRIL